MTDIIPPELQAPPDLQPAATTIWNETLQRLHQLGHLGKATPDLLRAHVEAVYTHRRASNLLGQTDILIERSGHAVPSPTLAIQKQAADTITQTTRALGLNRGGTPDASERGGQPMQPGGRPEVNEFGARWCADHGRYECTGQRRSGRGQCHGPAALGLNTCRMHKGAHGHAKHLAAKAAALRPKTGGTPVPTHPADALLQEVAYWTGLCAWLDEIVGGLSEGAAVWGMAQRTASEGGEFPGVTVLEKAGLNTWVEWQQRAHREKALVAKMALDAQVDAAALQFQQAQGMQAFRVFERAIEVAGLDERQWERVREAMPGLIRSLFAGQAALG
jgi:phage terminase small subunit